MVRTGRPKSFAEDLVMVRTFLPASQVEQLDDLAHEVRIKTLAGITRPMKRAEIMRAILTAFCTSGLDLSKVAEEAELTALVSRKLRRR